jgi:hypothetical protein
MRLPRKPALVAICVALAAAAVGSSPAGAHTLPAKPALAKAAQVARQAGVKAGASEYYAFGCQRRSAHVVDCVGAIVFATGEGCAQVVRVSYANHSSKAPAGRLIGEPVCGDPADEGFAPPSDSGGSSGGGETAICAIRGSVCISGN